MKRIAAVVEYDGSLFSGWQSQAHRCTVQDELERAISAVAAHPVRVHCAGRTDAGVHASAQVIHFDVAAQRPLTAWVRGVNALLPPAVVVRWAGVVDEHFHARFSASARRYRYILHNVPVRPALLAGKVGWFHSSLDEQRMAEGAACLLGRHDFSAFRAAGCQAKTAVRTLHQASVSRQGDYLLFDFHADGFLHHMVRNLVGALVYVGKGAHQPAWMAELLGMRTRSLAAPTFAADGLYLCGVDYPPRWPLPGDGRIIVLPQLPLA